MHWIDWLIVAIPLIVVFMIAIKAQKYVKGVADFLTAGRVAGRYVVAVAGAEAGMGLISLVAIFEVYYNSGFAYSFWQAIATPLGIVMLLSGYCIYRYRETRAMTMGQFLEMRYNRSFRIMAAALQSISGVLNYAIFPAVGARFLIYFCDLPLQVQMLGMTFPTFGLIMALFLSIAVIIISMGGQITIMVTDCVQGILSYPFYAIIVVFILLKLSWTQDMIPTLMDRPAGESMLNPFDISKLRTFNLFYIFVGILGSVFNRMSWSGTQGYNAAALNAHEQKMGAVLGTWRAGFSAMMILLLAISGYTFLNNAKFASEAKVCRQELATKVVADVVPDKTGVEFKQEISTFIETGIATESVQELIGEPVSEDSDEILRDSVKQAISAKDKSSAQAFNAIFNQMRVPLALRHLLPVGVMGVFCALCIFLLISTDTTYMHSWGSIIVQDLILPIRGKPLTPHQQLRLLRIVIAGVAVFAFLFSFFFAQIDFIMMFFAITGAIWIGGSGPVIVGGLYWKRGTTAGAFSALIAGSSIATGGIIIQKIWAPHIYPWLESKGYIAGLSKVMESMSAPFEPYIMWRVTPDKFPINSQEIYFFTILIGIFLYITVSLLTSKKSFNMDRMLHRGKYRREGEEIIKEKMCFKLAIKKMVGIDSQYTKGDKVLAWSVFVWSMGIGFGSFIITIIWNAIYPWPDVWWGYKFTIFGLIIPCIVGLISTFWFTIGGVIDLRKMFKKLDEKEDNLLDDGRVIGHVSADDVALVEEIEHVTIEEAHIEEHQLEDALEKEGDDEDLEKLKHQLEED